MDQPPPPDNFNSSYLEHQWTSCPPDNFNCIIESSLKWMTVDNFNCIQPSLTTSETSSDQPPSENFYSSNLEHQWRVSRQF